MDIRPRRPPAQPTQPPIRKRRTKRFKLSKKILLFAALSLTTIVAAAVILWQPWQHEDLNKVEAVKYRIAKHLMLPANEQPALITVIDRSKLQTPFLKQAENGDKILVYQSNRQAVIYRPGADRIVAVGPVIIDPPK
jgi:hypothetical protein